MRLAMSNGRLISLGQVFQDYPNLEAQAMWGDPVGEEALAICTEVARLREANVQWALRVQDLSDKLQAYASSLPEQIAEAAMIFTFRNTMKSQSDADAKLNRVMSLAMRLQQERHPDRKWDTPI